MGEHKELILIRGLPGSGKSTLARRYAQRGYVQCEADSWFVRGGKYSFDPKQLNAAHKNCQSEAEDALSQGRNVVVANTFTTAREVRPYRLIAERQNAHLKIETATGNFESIHGVPEHVINNMRTRWECVE